ncbi:MAG: FAD-dependent monooxygenase [Bacteroidia bacterium]|nr:FAD-dependent monooxygenase [Bacteroidia bacterium]
MEFVNIVGAGLAGSLMSVYLAQKGMRVKVYERRPDMRKKDIGGGRSINLAMSARAIKALTETGLIDEIMTLAIPMYGREMHSKTGQLTFQPYSHDPKECIYSVSRAELNMRLMNKAEALELVDFQFETICEEINPKTGAVTLRNLDTDTLFQAQGSRTIATDGAFSSVRYAMQKMPRFDFSQQYLSHGYKELTIPPLPDGSFRMKREALHIWPRGEYMMIALPNPDGSFTCTLFFPFEGKTSFDSLDTEAKVLAFFEDQFPDAVPLMPTLLEDYFTNPTSSLVTIRCWPWVLEDKIAILGDAAHAIVPFFGQGMNAAFEDCTILSRCLDEQGLDWMAAFEAFQQERKPNADAIANMALENYIEMRDTTADPEFLFRKAVEHYLEQHLESYRSRYELVSFTTVPYAEAYRRGQVNQGILKELMKGISRPEEVDLALAERLKKDRLM